MELQILSVFSTCSSDVILEENESVFHTGNGKSFVCAVSTTEKTDFKTEGSESVDIFADGLIVVSVCATHYKIGCNDGVGENALAKLFDNLEAS